MRHWGATVAGALLYILAMACTGGESTGGERPVELVHQVNDPTSVVLPAMAAARRQLLGEKWDASRATTSMTEDTADLLRRRSANINKFWGHLMKVAPHASLTAAERAAHRRNGSCTLRECEGVDLLAHVKMDLTPWRKRGGVTLADTEAAQKKGCAFGEEDGHYFDCIQGWVRIMIINNTLWSTHFGEGFGTRDGVFLIALLELLARHKVGSTA